MQLVAKSLGKKNKKGFIFILLPVWNEITPDREWIAEALRALVRAKQICAHPSGEPYDGKLSRTVLRVGWRTGASV